jgi:hypothetical protein
MARLTAGFLLGCIVSALVVWFGILPGTREAYRAVGVKDGIIQARWEIAQQIPRKIGVDVSPGEHYEELFAVKATSVVVVERNGVKTLRVIE